MQVKSNAERSKESILQFIKLPFREDLIFTKFHENKTSRKFPNLQ